MNQVRLARTVTLCAMASGALGAYAMQPPLPPGSARVKIAPGQSKEETERTQRAHRDPSHRKDHTHDDTTGADEIVPPPLPHGSTRIRIEPGQSPDETRKMLRAHQHPNRFKRDDTHADTSNADDRGPKTDQPKSKPSPPIRSRP